jgi:hypothetical protein
VELGTIRCPNPSLKCTARHSLLREFNLTTISVYAKKKLHYDKVWKKGSALYKLRRRCRQNLKFVSDVEANTLVEDISTSLECRGYQVFERYF